MPKKTIEETRKWEIGPLTTIFGALDMTQIKDMFGRYIELTERDLEMSNSRNEQNYRQSIGNINSHQKGQGIVDYPYGYRLIKGDKKSIFRPTKGLRQKTELTTQEQQDMMYEISKMLVSHPLCQKHTLVDANTINYIEIVETYEKQKAQALYGCPIDRIFNLPRDFKILFREFGIHLLSINESGDAIEIFVQEKTDTYALNDEAQYFVRSRSNTGYRGGKSFICFVTPTTYQLEYVSTTELEDLLDV